MKTILSFFLLAFSLNLFAAGKIKIENPKIRLTPPNAPMTAIFMNMTNHSDKDVKLVDVKGDFAGKFELHNMEMANGKMVMRKVESIEVKQHETTELKSGGLHIMVFKLKNPLKEGAVHKISLIFDNKTTVAVDAKVEKM